MKMVTAIIRTSSLEHVVSRLEKIGIRGLTFFQVKGIGEEVRLSSHYSIHDQIEIIVPDDRADAVAGIIAEHAATGLAGDGLVAVSPVDYAVKIRTNQRLE